MNREWKKRAWKMGRRRLLESTCFGGLTGRREEVYNMAMAGRD